MRREAKGEVFAHRLICSLTHFKKQNTLVPESNVPKTELEDNLSTVGLK
jgi:hypothetical protein